MHKIILDIYINNPNNKLQTLHLYKEKVEQYKKKNKYVIPSDTSKYTAVDLTLLMFELLLQIERKIIKKIKEKDDTPDSPIYIAKEYNKYISFMDKYVDNSHKIKFINI